VSTPSASAKRDPVALRAATLRAVRAFFDDLGFIEVVTPTRLATPALEEHIDAVPAGGAWLRTSPELQMKQLVQQGHHRIYQLGPCFRADEYGVRHRCEFTMLEWYWAPADYEQLRRQTEALIRHVVTQVLGTPVMPRGDRQIAVDGPAEVITVETAFAEYANCTPAEAIAADRFELDLVEKVEPRLGCTRPTFLIDYPASLAALARVRADDDPPVAERWELYVDGIELANAYSELTDPVEQRRRFEACAAARRDGGRIDYGVDEDFLGALAAGMPATAGCALGIDRLLMLLAGVHDIGEVIWPHRPST
jgi:lysyl-tRNA synthetase class 2